MNVNSGTCEAICKSGGMQDDQPALNVAEGNDMRVKPAHLACPIAEQLLLP